MYFFFNRWCFFWSWLLPKANCPSDQVIKFVESQPAASWWNPPLAGFQTLLPRECHLHWRIAHAQKCKLKLFCPKAKYSGHKKIQDPLCYPLTPQDWLAYLKFEGFKDISSHNDRTFVGYVRGINCKKIVHFFATQCWADGWGLFLGAVQPDAIFLRFLARLMPFWGGPAILRHISIPIASWL